jgi:hypothetical protein
MRIVVRMLIVSLLAAATSLQAITYIVPNDRDLVKRADAIIIATAVESHPELRDGDRLVTVATLQVERVLKGSVGGETVQLVELGGAVGNRVTLIPGSPRYDDGKRYLVFLRTNNLGEWVTYGFALGKFEFISDLHGRELLTRGGTDEDIFGLDESDGSLHVELLRGGPEFLSFVASRVDSEAPARESYFVRRSEVVFAKFPEFAPHATAFVPHALTTRPDYMLDCGGSPCRWPNPTAPFYHCCNAQTGGTGLDGPSASSAAMAAWNSVSGAGIHYTLTGADPNPNPVPHGLDGTPDSKNDIIFNDRHGVVASHGGAAAVGGITNASGPTPLGDGFTYFNTSEVDVETANNLPSFVDQNLLIQLLTHELGHTLGFRHADGTSNGFSPPPSCQSPSPCASIGQAIMASVIPKPNSIGNLGQWDIDAAQTVYGSGPVCNPPAITGQPSNVTITSGQQTTLTVTATGTSPTYQWYVGNPPNTSVLAQNGTGFQLTVAPTATTTYWVRVSGCSRTIDSNGATVTVNPPVCVPPNSSAPNASPSSIPAGQSSTLSVNPTGTGPFTYQWYAGNQGVTTTPVNNGTNSSVTVSPTVSTNYWVRITGQCAPVKDSLATLVTVTCSPIGSGPGASPSTINVGQSSTLSLTTQGSGPFTFQWYTGNLGDTSHPINGANGTSTVVSPTATSAFWVHVTASCGSQDAGTIVFVNGTVCNAPSITTQPAGATIGAGTPITLTVAASGTAPLTFQWYIGDKGDTSNQIVGATSSSLTQSPIVTTKYWVRVSNSCNGVQTADSNSATVTVSTCTNPTITVQPSNTSAPIGTAATLKVTATGTSLHYQWFQGAKGDTSNPTGAPDSATFVTGAISSNKTFWVRVSGACGTPVDSNAATVTAIAPPRGRAARH